MLLGHENTMVELRMEGGTRVQLRRAALFRSGTCDGVSGVGLMLEESEKVMLRTSCPFVSVVALVTALTA